MDSLARGALARLAVAALTATALLWIGGAFVPSHAPRAKSALRSPRSPRSSFGKLPLAFEANKGQLDRRIDFLARGHGYTLALERDRAVLARRHSHTLVSMRFLGASRTARLRPRSKLPGVVNSLIGPRSHWRTGIPTYGRVGARNLYPGVDLTWHGPKALEYDLTVAPGASTRPIRVRFSGAAPSLTRAGDLKFPNGLRVLQPRAWQHIDGERRPVAARFAVHGHTIGFRLGRRDPQASTIVDPEIGYSTYLGGNGDLEWANSVAVDSAHAVYVAGFSDSTDFPVARTLETDFDTNGFAAKLAPSGSSLEWATYFGGSDFETPPKLALDPNGNVYVAGSTNSLDFPTTPGSYQPASGCAPQYPGTPASCSNGYVLKLDPTGRVVYSTYLGGSGTPQQDPYPGISSDSASSVAVDAAGDAYVVGLAGSTDFPTTPGAAQPTHAASTAPGFDDGFVTELDPTGSSLLYSTFLGASSEDSLSGIAVASDGTAYVAGFTSSADLATKNVPANQQTALAGPSDMLFASVAPDGKSFGVVEYLGSSSGDYAAAVALNPVRFVDNNISLYVAGVASAGDFPLAGFPAAYGGSDDGVAALLRPDGSVVQSTYIGGRGVDDVTSVTTDALGNAYLAGSTTSSDFPSVNAIQAAVNPSAGEAWAAKFYDLGIAPVWSTYIGGALGDGAQGIAVDGDGRAYVVGYTSSDDFPLGDMPLTDTLGGNEDAFITKLQARPVVIRSGPAAITAQTRADISFRSNDFQMSYLCSLDGKPWTNLGANSFVDGEYATCRPTAHILGLKDGPHRFRIQEFDFGGNRDPRVTTVDWLVDTTPPDVFDLIGPTGDATASTRPLLSWHAASDATSVTYHVLIDGVEDQSVKDSDACKDGVCTAAGSHTLITGKHSWQVHAVDAVGNARDSAAASFIAFDPPTARLTVSPNPALVGRPVTFDASASADSAHTITKYEWDLDGDGAYELDTGTTPTTTRSYDTAGSVNVSLRVTDASTLSSSSTTELRISRGNERVLYGVTINGGEQYTNSPKVKVGAVFPPATTRMLLSNDGGFLKPTEVAPAARTEWTLDSSGPERLPKIVYARFLLGGIVSETYSDDIILDERPPVMADARLKESAPSGAQAAALQRWHVRVIASDTNSGVRGIQLTRNKKRPGRLHKYRRVITVTRSTPPKFARARDRAGNYSRWRRIR